jgi:hypothetical protein
MNKVYIINKSGHDYSKAEKYGEIVYLSEGKVNPMQVTKLYREFSEALANSDKDDYLLITGLPIMSCIASSIMAHKHGYVNWLIWHPVRKDYVERSILIGELVDKEES